MIEQEVQWSRRAFPEAQALLRGVPLAGLRFVEVGWHDATTHPEVGSIAVVRTGGPLEDLVGEVLRVTRSGREVFVYCYGGAGVPTDLSLARRPFMALDHLARESSRCGVEAVR